MNQTIVFIHGLWRTGSTYVWSRFRALPEVCAYYELFHEALGCETRQELANRSPGGWASRHPHLDTGYFAEYLPLIGGRGIPGFDKSFPVDHFFAENPDTLEPERRYIASLVAHAKRRGQAPVFGCCRTIGRAPWLRTRFRGMHILLVRDPRQQWYSGYARRREAGQAYFEVMPYFILGKAEFAPARRVARMLGIPMVDATTVDAEYQRYAALLDAADPEQSYAAFYAVLSLSLDRALPVADLVIDIDRLSADPTYRIGVERAVRARTKLDVSFGDAAVARHDIPPDLMNFDAIERSVSALLCRGSQLWRPSIADRAWRILWG
jgi:hypothetical protein